MGREKMKVHGYYGKIMAEKTKKIHPSSEKKHLSLFMRLFHELRFVCLPPLPPPQKKRAKRDEPIVYKFRVSYTMLITIIIFFTCKKHVIYKTSHCSLYLITCILNTGVKISFWHRAHFIFQDVVARNDYLIVWV